MTEEDGNRRWEQGQLAVRCATMTIVKNQAKSGILEDEPRNELSKGACINCPEEVNHR